MKDSKLLLISSIMMVFSVVIVALIMILPKYQKNDSKVFKSEGGDLCIADLCLIKTGEKWMIKTKDKQIPADSEIVENFIKQLTKMELGQVISSNSDKYANLGFGGTSVELSYAGVKLEVGKINSSYDGTYVRVNSQGPVHNSNVIIEKDGLSKTSYWESKKITNIPKQDIVNILMNNNKKTLEITPKDGAWPNEKLIERLTYLDGKYTTEISPTWEKAQRATINLRTNSVELWWGKETDNNRKVKFWASSDKSNIYEIDAKDFELLTEAIK